MDREDIIRMARECQFAHYYESGDLVAMPQLERFAALVAAAEREACAKVCEDIAMHRDVGAYGMLVAHSCANEILARGEK